MRFSNTKLTLGPYSQTAGKVKPWQDGFPFKVEYAPIPRLLILYTQCPTPTLKSDLHNPDTGKEAWGAARIWEEVAWSENLMEPDWGSLSGAIKALLPTRRILLEADRLVLALWLRTQDSGQSEDWVAIPLLWRLKITR